MSDDPTRELDDAVAGCAAAHQRLHASIGQALDAGRLDPSAPSLLPDWTMGHVLTHLARNADALRQMIEGARLGEEHLMYASAEQRTADIEAGAGRGAVALVDDVRRSSWALESAWARLETHAWDGFGLARIERIAVRSFPWRRWREVEVHHSDLGLADFGPADWSAAFVASDGPRRLADWESVGNELPAAVASAEPSRRLAWLFGRDAGPGLPTPPTM